MTDMVKNIYKKEGETPLLAMQKYREKAGMEEDVPMTYAGRLDPLASGVLIGLFGEARFRKNEFLALSKEYVVDILVGISTDTGDVLGLAEECVVTEKTNSEYVQKTLASFVGVREEYYPKFSSKPHNGKPLFTWAKSETDVPLPTHHIEISSIDMINISEKSLHDVVEETISRVNLIEGDFRQEAIIRRWQSLLDEEMTMSCEVVQIRVSCGSGAYMRVLAEQIARALGYPGLAYRIVRTRVGDFRIEESEK